MSNINFKMNLRQLQSTVKRLKSKSGNEIDCLIIPIDNNKLFRGEKGVYLDLIGFELKEKSADRKDTHILKQSFSKEIRDKMTDEQKQNQPIMGSAIDWSKVNFEPEPNQADVEAPAPDESDDLPF